MASLSVGTQATRFNPGQSGTLVNLGSSNVYIDTVQPNANSTPIAPLGGITLDGSKSYWLQSSSGTQGLTFLPGMTAYLPSSVQISSILGTSAVSVSNTPTVNLNQEVFLTNQAIAPTVGNDAHLNVAVPNGIMSLVIEVRNNSGNPMTQAPQLTVYSPMPTINQQRIFQATVGQVFDARFAVDCQSGQNQIVTFSVNAAPGDTFTATVFGYPVPASMVNSAKLIVGKDASGNMFDIAGVGLLDSTGKQMGVPGNPAVTVTNPGASSSAGIGLTVAMQQVIGGPAVGFKRTVDTVAIWGATAGDTIGIGVNNNASNLAFNWTQTPPWVAGWTILNGGVGIYASNSSGARGNIYLQYHDEAI